MSLPSLGGKAEWMRGKQEWTSDDAVLSLLSLEAYLVYATHCQRAESGAETHYLGTLPGEDNNNTATIPSQVRAVHGIREGVATPPLSLVPVVVC